MAPGATQAGGTPGIHPQRSPRHVSGSPAPGCCHQPSLPSCSIQVGDGEGTPLPPCQKAPMGTAGLFYNSKNAPDLRPKGRHDARGHTTARKEPSIPPTPHKAKTSGRSPSSSTAPPGAGLCRHHPRCKTPRASQSCFPKLPSAQTATFQPLHGAKPSQHQQPGDKTCCIPKPRLAESSQGSGHQPCTRGHPGPHHNQRHPRRSSLTQTPLAG